MSRIPRKIFGDTVYHVLNRSNERKTLFHGDEEYRGFEKILREAKEKYPMRILAFCLMPNHWHLVVYPHSGEDLSRYIRWVTHTHAQRYRIFNKSVGSGHVYQGRFKSFAVETDAYFLEVCRYVERNPLRAGMVLRAQEWQWSSFWIRKYGTLRQKQMLSDWSISKTSGYDDWVNTLQKEEEEKLKKIRYSVERGGSL